MKEKKRGDVFVFSDYLSYLYFAFILHSTIGTILRNYVIVCPRTVETSTGVACGEAAEAGREKSFFRIMCCFFCLCRRHEKIFEGIIIFWCMLLLLCSKVSLSH